MQGGVKGRQSYVYFLPLPPTRLYNMQQKIPPYLKPGDKVAVVAPAGKVDEEKLKPALSILVSWGLEVICGENLYRSNGYFAGTDQERLSDLQNVIDNPEVKAVFCVRGGYGITRIIDNLDVEAIKVTPKWIVGFSDITALHLKLSNHNVQSVHGIMPAVFNPEQDLLSVNHLRDFLFGKISSIEFDSTRDNITGETKGFLRGGNLSILADCIGTKTALETENTILFIEEVDEYLYKIDRMLTHLQRTGALEKIKGLLIGHFTSVKDTSTPFGKSLQEVILEKVSELNIPVAFGLPAGHDKPNLALPHNRFVSLSVSSGKTIIKF